MIQVQLLAVDMKTTFQIGKKYNPANCNWMVKGLGKKDEVIIFSLMTRCYTRRMKVTDLVWIKYNGI